MPQLGPTNKITISSGLADVLSTQSQSQILISNWSLDQSWCKNGNVGAVDSDLSVISVPEYPLLSAQLIPSLANIWQLLLLYFHSRDP